MRSIKILILITLLFLVAYKTHAQTVQPLSYKDYSAPYQFNIGGGVLKTTAPSAYVEVGMPSGSTKGFLLPRGNKDAIASPAMGLVIYDIPTSKVWWYTGSQWATAGTDTSSGGIVSTITYQSPISLVGSTVKWLGNTTNVPEGLNLYWTQNRFDLAFAGKTTTNLTEGSNLYYTNARVQTFGDTRYALKTQTLAASDTQWLHDQLALLRSQGGTLSTIKYINGIYYKLSTNEVGAYYWEPIWNANKLQNIPIKAIQPLHGMGLHYDANADMWVPSFDSSFAGGGVGGINLDSLYWIANDSDFTVDNASSIVGIGSRVSLAQRWKDIILNLRTDVNNVLAGGMGRPDSNLFTANLIQPADRSHNGNGKSFSITGGNNLRFDYLNTYIEAPAKAIIDSAYTRDATGKLFYGKLPTSLILDDGDTTNSGGGGGCPYVCEAMPYIDSVAANGYSWVSAEKTAISNYVTGLKNAGLWNIFEFIYPLRGTTATQQSFNLINPAQDQLVWVGAGTWNANGYKPGGSGTGFAGKPGCYTSLTLNNYTAGVYSNENIASGNNILSGNSNDEGVRLMDLAGQAGAQAVGANNVSIFVTVPTAAGFTLYTASDFVRLYKNGALIGTSAVAPTDGVLPGACNPQLGSVPQNICFAFLAKRALTPSEVTTFSSLTNTLMTAFSRNVY